MSYSWYMLLFFNSEFHCGTKLTVHKIYISKLLLWSNCNSATIDLVSNDSLMCFFSLWRIDDLKLRIKITKIWQVNWTEHLFCSVNRANFTNVVTFNNKNFYLFSFDCCNFSSTTYLQSLFEKTTWLIEVILKK